MIFAKLDVCFYRHAKFVRAGLEACAYWAAALAYLRDNLSEDGRIQTDEIGLPLHVGDRKARQLCERLVEVGLFERHEAGYVLSRYADKNETGQQVQARVSATRERLQRHRTKRASHAANGAALAAEAQPETQMKRVSTALQCTRSNAVETLSESESESESESDPLESAQVPCAPRAKGSRVPKSEASADVVAAFAKAIAADVSDPQWSRFLDHWRAQPGQRGVKLDWSAAWRNWLRKAPEFERTPFAGRQWAPAGVDRNQYDSPAVRVERARREADYAQAKANAVPAPISDLMAAIGGTK